MATLTKLQSTVYPGRSERNWHKFQYGHTGDHVTPTNYTAHGGRYTSHTTINTSVWYRVDTPNMSPLHEIAAAGGNPSWFQPTLNQAYSRFVESVRGAETGLGETIAEMQSNLGIIASSATRMRNSWKAIRRLDLRNAIRGLTRADLVKHAKGRELTPFLDLAAGTWLTYIFGVKPTTQAIYDSAVVLSSDPEKSGSGLGVARYDIEASQRWYKITGTGSSKSDNWWSQRSTSFARYQADWRLVNPNLLLATQLGLTNPVSLAWDLLPFSFLLDWVVDIGTFLGSFTDFLGLDLTNECTTMFHKGSCAYHTEKYPGNEWYRRTDLDFWYLNRDNNIVRPLPNVEFRQNVGSSLTRATTSVALLWSVLRDY